MKTNKKSKYQAFKKSDFSDLVPNPKKETNKYSRGVAIIAAGSKNYPGAAILASRASQRAGAGYTKLYTIQSNVSRSAFSVPSCPVAAFNDFTKDQLSFVIKNRPHAILVGSGFIPKSSYNNTRLKTALNFLQSPVIIDGGALSCFSNKEVRDLLIKRSNNKSVTILTPHMGEAVQILKSYNVNTDNLNPKKIAKKINELTGSTVVLKGPNTYIYNNDNYTLIKNGGPELAKAGTGDVLAGILLGLLSQQRISTFEVSALAVYIHALAGKCYTKKFNNISLLPEDLIDFVPVAINKLQR